VFYHQNLFKSKQTKNDTMNKWIELLVGLILVVASVYVWGMDILGAGTAALEFLKGGIIWFVIMIGALFILLGISDLKE